MPSYSALSPEDSYFVGVISHDILYGVELCLYLKTMHIFLARKQTRRQSDVFYAIFSTVMFILATIFMAINAMFGHAEWITGSNHLFESTPYGYINLLAAVAFILQQMTDGLMVYRCRLVWDADGYRVLIVPFILWLATLVLGILAIWISSSTRTDFFVGSVAKIGLAYYSTSVFLNVILTCMICYRLVCYAKTVKEHLGDRYASPYFTVLMLLVESVLPYTISGIAFLVSYGVGSWTETALSHVYTLMTCVSPQMLILRVAEGNAWQRDTIKPPLSMIKFSPGSTGTTSSGVPPSESAKDDKV